MFIEEIRREVLSCYVSLVIGGTDQRQQRSCSDVIQKEGHGVQQICIFCALNAEMTLQEVHSEEPNS